MRIWGLAEAREMGQLSAVAHPPLCVRKSGPFHTDAAEVDESVLMLQHLFVLHVLHPQTVSNSVFLYFSSFLFGFVGFYGFCFQVFGPFFRELCAHSHMHMGITVPAII